MKRSLKQQPKPKKVVRHHPFERALTWAKNRLLKAERMLAKSWVSPTEPGKSQQVEVVEQIRTTERLCRYCGGEHLGQCSEDGCSANPRRGRY